MSRKNNRKKQKKKKRFSGQQRKQHYARMANEYFKRLEKFAVSCGLQETIANLPKDLKKMILDNCIDKFVVEAPDAARPGPDQINEILSFLDTELNNSTFHILPDQEPVSLYDFFTLGWTLYLFLNYAMDSSLFLSGDIEEKLKALEDSLNKPGGADEMLGMIYFTLSVYISTIDKGYYMPEIVFGIKDQGFPHFYVKILLKFIPGELIDLEIQGKKRPVYRVGWPFNNDKITWINLQYDRINAALDSAEFSYPVYIQMHALVRLEERLDCLFSTSIRHLALFESLHRAKIQPGHDDTILIDYYYLDKKFGYLVLEKVEDKFVIRTFLFITQDGTPEGRKLRELAGLSKTDKKYWELDKLSTFFSKDLRSNRQICTLLADAGCDDLLQFEPDNMQELIYNRSFADFASFLSQTMRYKSGFDFKID